MTIVNPRFWDRRSGESEYAHARRLAPYLHLREEAQTEAAQSHADFRQRQDVRTSGTGHGLLGSLSPEERATAAGTHGFAGDQELASRRLGGVVSTSSPGQVSIPRIYASDLRNDEPAMSPLMAHMRNSAADWR
jgi:hypothetical protein